MGENYTCTMAKNCTFNARQMQKLVIQTKGYANTY